MQKITLKVICYAGVQKYFGSELSIELDTDSTYKQVLEKLSAISPKAEEVLSSCRIAVNQQFVSLADTIIANADINIIPPSSGG